MNQRFLSFENMEVGCFELIGNFNGKLELVWKTFSLYCGRIENEYPSFIENSNIIYGG